MDSKKMLDHWDEKKDKIREQYPTLTKEDLEYEIGREEELLLKLQEKLKKNRHEIEKVLSLLG